MWEGPAPCRVGPPEWCKKAGWAKNMQASKQASKQHYFISSSALTLLSDRI